MTPALEAGHQRHEFWHPFIGEETINYLLLPHAKRAGASAKGRLRLIRVRS